MKPYYECDGVTIYHGDCREFLPTVTGDLVLTDPPFGVLDDQEWDDMDQQEFVRFSSSWLCQLPDCDLVTFMGEHTRGAFVPLLERMWVRVRQLVWSKGFGTVGQDRLWYSFESIWYCTNQVPWEVVKPKLRTVAELIRAGRATAGLSRGAVDMAVRGKRTGLCYRWEEAACLPTDEQIAVLKKLLPLGLEFDEAMAVASDEREDTLHHAALHAKADAAVTMDVFRYRVVQNPAHPCEKPIGLMHELLRTVGASRAAIIDPFMGVGTTLRAAKELGRTAVGIEKNERYCEIAARRLDQGVLDLGAA